jgi:hypothetical protein
MERKKLWKRGRGALRALAPLLGKWKAETDSPLGRLKCTRRFEPVLGGRYVQLTARWSGAKLAYEELAVFGVVDGVLRFWSFTSDGKRSEGRVADGTDVHPEALAFEAQMPAGLARQIFWPGQNGRVHWAVESRTKKGWRRFMEQQWKRG